MSKNKYPIKEVASNKEKWLSYKENFDRFNKAREQEFYLECLWILYAMIEDRTSAFLYYLGFTSKTNRNKVTGSKNTKKCIQEIFNLSNDKGKRYKFNNLSGKLTRINEIVVWGSNTNDESDDYKVALQKAVSNCINKQELLESLNYLNNEWRDKRNQLTHDLFNKDSSVITSELITLVEKGYNVARVIDKSVQLIKSEDIRNRFRIR